MQLHDIKYCPGTLAEGYASYSPGCLRNMFNGRKVDHVLNYTSPNRDESTNELFLENRNRISISGVQEKLSLILDKNQLRLTQKGEQGTYILKPVPRDLKKVDQVPANEHLTMQLAKQVYGINTAENAMVFFADGEPAYLTKRFDVLSNKKLGKEDFASLAGKTKDNAGPNFKYEYSYEELGLLIPKYVPAWRIEIEKFFQLVLFNYLFSNGDAHLKNFALLETNSGDYILSPAYDLINTSLHVGDSDFALERGLFADNFISETHKKTGHTSKTDFIEFASRIGIVKSRIEKLIGPFLEKQNKVELLVKHSFLKEPEKRGYLLSYNQRRNLLIKV